MYRMQSSTVAAPGRSTGRGQRRSGQSQTITTPKTRICVTIANTYIYIYIYVLAIVTHMRVLGVVIVWLCPDRRCPRPVDRPGAATVEDCIRYMHA